jgi:hypothetical protein
MLTLFTLPKPFEGDIGRIQRNALRSWKQLDSDCQVILCGDAPDLDDVATELSLDRVSGIARNSFGTPLVSSAFDRVAETARHDLLCYANTDLIFFSDFTTAVEAVANQQQPFLMVGECRDVAVDETLTEDDFAVHSPREAALRLRASTAGRLRGPEWIDFFVFRRGTIGPLPAFAVGRPGWDNWMIWHARSSGMSVVDVTDSALVVHQSHNYTHVPKGTGSRWEGPEADANRTLLRFEHEFHSLHFATHRLVGSAVVPKRLDDLRVRLLVTLLRRRSTVPIYRLLRASYRRFASRPD